MSTDEKIARIREFYLHEAGATFDYHLSHCESPVEQLLLAEMLGRGWRFPSQIPWTTGREIAIRLGLQCTFIFEADDCLCFCLPQATWEHSTGRYRLDFAFVSDERRIAVEVDGHDFHERTKEQASRDKKRDRVLTRGGWKVLRFTGSDVFRDPEAVVDEIVDLANGGA